MIDIKDLPEPADGTILGIVEHSGTRLIWRHDDEARQRGGRDGEHWFRTVGPDNDPVTWAEVLKDARLVYEMGSVIARKKGRP